MPEVEESESDDWRISIGTATETLKVLDGEVVHFTFKNEGVPKSSIDYGKSVAFLVRVDGEDKNRTLYVKANNFDLLGQIKALGSLTDLHVELSRRGSKKSDTRYTIKKL